MQNKEAIQARRAVLQWVADLIDHGHDLGTLRAQIAGELEWLAPRSRRLGMIADRVQHLRESGAMSGCSGVIDV